MNAPLWTFAAVAMIVASGLGGFNAGMGQARRQAAEQVGVTVAFAKDLADYRCMRAEYDGGRHVTIVGVQCQGERP